MERKKQGKELLLGEEKMRADCKEKFDNAKEDIQALKRVEEKMEAKIEDIKTFFSSRFETFERTINDNRFAAVDKQNKFLVKVVRVLGTAFMGLLLWFILNYIV